MKCISFSIICACMMFGCIACDDITQVDEVLAGENIPSTGAPAITKIVMANDTTGTPIETAAFTQVVRIEGTNLGNVTSLKFNDVDVDLSEVYSSYDAVLAKVPRVLPETVTDRVYVSTKLGETSAPLKVTIPELKIQGLYCEFAQPGDTTYIQGNDYDLYGITAEDAVVKVGDKDVNVLAACNLRLCQTGCFGTV